MLGGGAEFEDCSGAEAVTPAVRGGGGCVVKEGQHTPTPVSVLSSVKSTAVDGGAAADEYSYTTSHL